jgi:hypothetical protein
MGIDCVAAPPAFTLVFSGVCIPPMEPAAESPLEAKEAERT